jgi:hypothetical protein
LTEALDQRLVDVVVHNYTRRGQKLAYAATISKS